jgi:regulator of protease activity HflC (stomatin/prohibitin superfamily)
MWTYINLAIWVSMFLFVGYRFARCIRLVPNRKEYVVERLGKAHEILGPGFHVLIPFIDKVAYIQDLREEAIEVPPQECFTRDNVQVEVDGVLYISVTDAKQASYGVTDYRYAAIQLAQTTTRSVVGTLELDRTFEEREEINSRVVSVLGEVSETWGIKVHRYEIKNIVPPPSVRDSMEKQMAAERERRAILARAEGQKQSMINDSEGRKQEAINQSEGEKQRMINEAEGRAQEILSIASATAEGIRKTAAALTVPGGSEAVRMRLGQSYIKTIGEVARPQTKLLLPADVTALDALLKSIGLDAESAEAQAKVLAEEVKNAPPRPPRRAPAPPALPPKEASPTRVPSTPVPEAHKTGTKEEVPS